jgi:hypothetical protein
MENHFFFFFLENIIGTCQCSFHERDYSIVETVRGLNHVSPHKRDMSVAIEL